MVRLPSLEYSLTHPLPKSGWFLLSTLVIFSLALPALVLLNLATQSSELVFSLQSQYQPDETLVGAWWGSHRLPSWFRPKPPRCQPKVIHRGEAFQLATSLFDYTVMNVYVPPRDPTGEVPQTQGQIRAEYKGQNFSSCAVNSVQFDYNLFDQTQSVTAGVFCPEFPENPVNVSMQTTITFSQKLIKDFIGQYYDHSPELLGANSAAASDYRRVVLAVLQVISTDSLTIMHRQLLPNPAGGISITFAVDPQMGQLKEDTSTLTYLNGSQPDQYPQEASIYGASIANLMAVIVDAVNLDLGSSAPPNLFGNASRLSAIINPNPPPAGINSSDWAEGSRTFYYGTLNGYQTWADALLHGQPVTVGNLTGFPDEGSVMVATYLCPSYREKPISSLVTSVLIGVLAMFLWVGETWKSFLLFIAKRIMAPRVICHCNDCERRRVMEAEEARIRAAEGGANERVTGILSRIMCLRRRKSSTSRDEEGADLGPLPYNGADWPERPICSKAFSETGDIRDLRLQ